VGCCSRGGRKGGILGCRKGRIAKKDRESEATANEGSIVVMKSGAGGRFCSYFSCLLPFRDWEWNLFWN